MTLARRRIVAKTITVTAHAPTTAKRRGTLGTKPVLPSSIVQQVQDGDYKGAQEVVHRYASKVKNPRTAIRAKCVECSGGSLKEVADCRVTTCALHPFRMGVNPFNKRTRERLVREGRGENEGGENDENDDEDSDAYGVEVEA